MVIVKDLSRLGRDHVMIVLKDKLVMLPPYSFLYVMVIIVSKIRIKLEMYYIQKNCRRIY